MLCIYHIFFFNLVGWLGSTQISELLSTRVSTFGSIVLVILLSLFTYDKGYHFLPSSHRQTEAPNTCLTNKL